MIPYSVSLNALRLFLLVTCTVRCPAALDLERDRTSSEPSSQCQNSHSLMQASTLRSTVQAAGVQAPTPPVVPVPVNHDGRKLVIEIGTVIVFIVVALACLRARGRGSFFHSQVEDVVEVAEAREGEDAKAIRESHEDDDQDDWTIGELIGSSLGLPDQDPLLESSPFDPDIIPKFIDAHYSSYRLLFQIALTLGQFWAALIYMYWALLSDDTEMMDCEAYPQNAKHATVVRHLCHYTRACLHGFPVIAANMTLVLMLRTLLQHRLYYSMLRAGYLVVFQSIPILHTIWPLAIALSMTQGGLHFVLKSYYAPDNQTIMFVLRLLRKFLLPGAVFFLILVKYADVENTLVPLNHIAELEVNDQHHHSPWLMRLKIMNERVLAFDVRHRDVFSEVDSQLNKAPSLPDILQNVINNYEAARNTWHARQHRNWGLFRSMWPAALLVDFGLDREDKVTRQWLITISILLAGCAFTSCLSIYLLLGFTKHFAWGSLYGALKTFFTQGHMGDTGHMLVTLVVLGHAMLLIVLVHHTVHHMWYFQFSHTEIEHATHDQVKREQTPTPTPVESGETAASSSQ